MFTLPWRTKAVTDYYGQCFSSTTVSATSTYPGVTSTLSIPLTTTTTQTKYVYPTVGVQRREGTTEVHEWHCTGTTTYTAKDWTATPNPTLTATSTVWARCVIALYTVKLSLANASF